MAYNRQRSPLFAGAAAELGRLPLAAANMAPALYWVVHPTTGWSLPTGAQVVAGQIGTGAAALSAGNEPSPNTSTTFTFATAASGLTSGVNYTGAAVWWDGTTYSNVVTGAFTAGAGLVSFWTGSAWAAKPVKHWTGSAWVQKPLRSWSGTAWV